MWHNSKNIPLKIVTTSGKAVLFKRGTVAMKFVNVDIIHAKAKYR